MKIRILKSVLLINLLTISIVNAQHFTEASTSIEATTVSSAKHSDVDGDGDLDLLITGYDGSADQIQIAKLFLNDGSGVFSEAADTPFTGVADGEIAFSDVDGDGDEDVIIAGLNTILDGETKLYLNDGNGIFTEDPNVPFANVYGCDIGFSDIDGDGDNDVLISGFDDIVGALNATLYTNDGNGVFTEVADTPFQGSWDGSVKFVDTDNDGDEDVIITGRDDAFAPSVILYTNENGTFTEVQNLPFIGVIFSAIDYADIDGDNDFDLLISGQNPFYNPVTALYINEGGTFIEDTSNSFPEIDFGSHVFADIDHDGDQDVLLTGFSRDQGAFVTISKLFTNDGTGVFTEAAGEPFVNVGTSAVTIFDANGDNAKDVFLIGDADSGSPVSGLYFNNNEIISSTEELISKSTFEIFPNPATNGKADIRFSPELINKPLRIKIFNITGKLFHSELITNAESTYSINTPTLPKGMYFIELSSNRSTNKEVIKLIIE